MGTTAKKTFKVFQYCVMPQILPRIADLMFSGFGYLAYFIAQVYRGVRLLPEGHPYLNASLVGEFSIPDVIAEAGKRLKYRMENIDQIIMFYVILLGMLLFAAQVSFLLISMFAPQAMALSLSDFFGNPHFTIGRDPYQDLAFIMLDRVFGVPGIFESCVSWSTSCYMAAPDNTWNTADTVYTPATFPWPFHMALHAMFSFYSTGLLIIAVMILLYLVVVVIAETAQTGIPFGKRYNKVWAPIRLVAALGLLIPLTYGLNAGQYIVLYAAKLGSNFATNGWVTFYSTLTNGQMISDQMVAAPNAPNPSSLLQFMMLAHACKAVTEGYMEQADIANFKPNQTCGVPDDDQQNNAVINAYLVKFTGNGTNDFKLLENTSYADARTFFNNGDMTIRIGDRGCGQKYIKQSGHTVPTCGELVLTSPTQETNKNAGAYVIQKGYYDLVQYLWGEYADPNNPDYTKIWAHHGYCASTMGGWNINNIPTDQYAQMTSRKGDMDLRKRSIGYAQTLCPADGTDVRIPISPYNVVVDVLPILTTADLDWISNTASNYQYGKNDKPYPQMVSPMSGYSPASSSADAITTNIIRKGVEAERNLITSGKYSMPIDLIDRGWAGAGLYYNNVAATNGAITSAALAMPKISKYPEVMEIVAQAKQLTNKNLSSDELFTVVKGQNTDIKLERTGYSEIIRPLSSIYKDWKKRDVQYKPQTGNMIYDFINGIFGTQGLFDLRSSANADVHPLAQMASMGKGLIEASIRNLGLAVAGNVAGGAIGSISSEMGVGADVISGVLFTIVMMTMGAGIILYYVLPFMPFIYFFFAVGSWIKEVFEAMVGVPLWALAHLRIDGDGLPGEAAKSGYFMIFEIFLRPIMIVFGLLASVAIFASMASVLNAIYDIAVVNVGGVNMEKMTGMVSLTEFARGPLDQLFYTILYAVLMYIIAMSSFKMIDLIPNQVMRWLGVSISAFASQTGDSAQSIMSNVQVQGLGKVDQALGGIREGSKGAGSAIGKITQ